MLPLDQNILTRNTGAALVVVLTKSDLAHSEMSDDQLDRLQYHVRKFCMAHGAALVGHFLSPMFLSRWIYMYIKVFHSILKVYADIF